MAARSSAMGKPLRGSKHCHAVSVRPGTDACAAAASAEHQRWLSREAPQLPLPGCTGPDSCRCTYQHHEDRRAGGRRAAEVDAFRPPVKTKTERRNSRDRRTKSEE